MTLTEKLRKRRFYPVTIGEETVHVRRLTVDEAERVDGIENGLIKAFFMVGCCLLDESGTPAYSRNDDESDIQFAERVKVEGKDIPADTLADITAGIWKATKVPSPGTTSKN